MYSCTRPPVKHLGKKIGRIREMLGMKQEILAEKMGISQQSVSKLEQSETIEVATLERVAKALGLNSEAVKNFSDESILNIITNTFTDFKDSAVGMNYQCTFNPIDKWLEAIDENKKLYLKRREERLLCWSECWRRSNEQFIEVSTFPNGKHDDQVDVLFYAIDTLLGGSGKISCYI